MKRLSIVLAIALVMATLSGLSAHQTKAAAADTIIVGSTDSAGSLDNADAYDNHAWEILQNTGEGLLKNKAGTLDLEPGLATDFPKISDDGLTYTFTLRDNLVFADGTPITAQTFVDSIKRVQTLKGQVAGLVTAYITSVEAPDAKTVVFKLPSKVGFFTTLIAIPPYYPVNPKLYTADKLNTFPSAIDGAGPYRLTSYKANEQAVFEVNPKYHGTQPLTKNIIVRYFGGAPQLAAAVEKGDVDISWRSLTVSDIVRLKKTDGMNIYTVPNGRILYLSFNHLSKPFDDPRIRQAISYLVDRDEIIDRAYQGQVKALYSMVPPGYPFVTDDFKKQYSSPQIDKAVALLKDAGYSADKPLSVEFNWPLKHYGEEAAAIAEVVKSELEKSGVIKVELKSTEWSTYIKTVSQSGYPFFLLGWFPDYPDTDDYLTPWGDSAANAGQGVNYKNPAMDKLLSDARAASDTATRTDLYAQAQSLYAKDAITVPLLIVGEYTAYKNGIVGADKVPASIIMDYTVLGRGDAAAATAAATAAK
ncbi:MAG: ABC transporter substrate-binding protein [Chloroflexota bacterium]